MVLLLLQLIGAFLWHTPFISSAAGLFQCLGQGFLASLTLQSELGVLCQRYFPGYEFYGNSYANNGIETITPDYFLINVISAYPHKSSICSMSLLRNDFFNGGRFQFKWMCSWTWVEFYWELVPWGLKAIR